MALVQGLLCLAAASHLLVLVDPTPANESRFSVAPGLGTILTSMLTSTRTDRHADEQLARWTSLALLAGLGMI